MKTLTDYIQWQKENESRKEDTIIRVKLEMINNLKEEIASSEDRIFMEQIISSFLDIIEMQREMIDELDALCNGENYRAAFNHNAYVPAQSSRLTPDDIPYAEDEIDAPVEALRARNPYVPPAGGFQTDEQIRKAFSNYLKYHTAKELKDGRQKSFSKYTVFDYCSRVNILWKAFYAELQDGKLDGFLSELEDCILPGCTFMNVYKNIRTLERYVEMKGEQLREVADGVRDAFSEDEIQNNPINSPKNYGNTVAALAKFKEFKKRIEQNQY